VGRRASFQWFFGARHVLESRRSVLPPGSVRRGCWPRRAAALAPFISNHWLFTSLINPGILLSIAYLMFKHRRLTVDRAELLATFAPAARMALIVLYFFVVFHKLNADFFDPVVSCGVTFYAAQLSRLPWLPASPLFHIGSIYATIAIEAAIPLMLCRQDATSVLSACCSTPSSP
jgi:hypothetical protein